MLDYKIESHVAVDMGVAFIQHAPNLQKSSMTFDSGERSYVVSETGHAYERSSTTNTATRSHTQQRVCIRG